MTNSTDSDAQSDTWALCRSVLHVRPLLPQNRGSARPGRYTHVLALDAPTADAPSEAETSNGALIAASDLPAGTQIQGTVVGTHVTQNRRSGLALHLAVALLCVQLPGKA